MPDRLENRPADFNSIRNLFTEEVQDYFWMLFGERGLSSIGSVRGIPDYGLDPRIRGLLDDLIRALRSGRFGTVDKEALELPLIISIHSLKIIDWFKDEDVLEKAESWGYPTRLDFQKLIEEWKSERDEPQKTHGHDIGFEGLAKGDVWTLSNLRLLLFGSRRASEYGLTVYHKFDPKIEKLMDGVDHCIDQGLAIGRITGQRGMVHGEPAYSSQEMLRELRFKDYPVPEGLIESREWREKGDWGIAEKLLRELHENMKGFIEIGGRITQTEAPAQRESTEKKSPGFLPAPKGTKWDDITMEITKNTQVRINIKNKSQLYKLEKFKEEVIPQEKIKGYLFQIIHSGGIFTKEEIDPKIKKDQFKNHISRLRKRLKEVFGIQDDPLLFQKQAYRTQFSVSSKLKRQNR